MSVFESAINALLKDWKKESADREERILAALTHTNQLLAQLVAATGQQPAGYGPPTGASQPPAGGWDGVVHGEDTGGGRSRWRPGR